MNLMEPTNEESLIIQLESLAVDELKGLFELVCLREQPVYSEITALLVILTACNENQVPIQGANEPRQKMSYKNELKLDTFTKHKKCFADPDFHGYNAELFHLFINNLRLNGDMYSKKNFGNPVFRRFTEAAGLRGAEGSETSRHFWKLMDSIVVEVPDRCSQSFESALLYLLMSDASSSFACTADAKAAVLAVEVPCLFEMFFHSELNNQNNLSALLTEYLALVRVCFYEGYIGEEYSYECCTVTYDFQVKGEKTLCQFSVKAISSETKYFGHLFKEDSLKCYDKFIHQDAEANIFLHCCNCESCEVHPVRKIEVTIEDSSEDELRKVNCNCNDNFEDILTFIQGEMTKRELRNAKVVIYLVATRLSNDLRFVLNTKDKFRRCQQKKFPLCQFLIQSLKDKFRDSGSGKLPEDFSKPIPIRTLVDRSN